MIIRLFWGLNDIIASKYIVKYGEAIMFVVVVIISSIILVIVNRGRTMPLTFHRLCNHSVMGIGSEPKQYASIIHRAIAF